MPLFTPANKQFSVHKLMAMSTMLTPTHHSHMQPGLQAGGGDASSDAPIHQLYLSHAIQEHLRRVYDSLRLPEPHLTKDRFAAWVATTQGHYIELDKDTYQFEQFIEAIYYNQGLEASLQTSASQKDLSRPISNYYISSSHNTYLSGNQLASKSTVDAYKNVLLRGCRCIEIDVHNGEPPDDKSSNDGTHEGLSQSISRSPKPDHKRHISGSTFSSRAAAALEKAEEKFDSAKAKLTERRGKDGSEDKDKGRPLSPTTLEVGNSIERPASVRSMRNGEPLVLHGWTLTAPVGFRAVCKAIRESAFVTSHLPIIVSLEVHADLEQQEVMVEIMKEEWKGLLVDEAHPACDPNERVPRLDELLNKILIKVKKSTPDKPEVAASSTLSPVNTGTDADSYHSGSEDERSKPAKKVKICKALGSLGIYTHSEHFKSFEAESAKKPPHVYSVGENQIMDLHENKRDEMFSHNRDFFMRAYPAGFRIDSSNLDPSIYWRKGIQMVALNWQNLDEGMMLNEGMFAGEHGWVLKPKGYRSDPTEPIQYKTLDLKITIFGGQHIPLPPDQTNKDFHPFVKCELHVEKPEERTGDPIEGAGRAKEGEYKAKTKYSRGDHPDFGTDGVVLPFLGITKIVEELSFLRIKVEDEKFLGDDLAAWACIRLDRLQQGYRFVHLLDAKGYPTAGLLMVRIEKTLR